MIELHQQGVYLIQGQTIIDAAQGREALQNQLAASAPAIPPAEFEPHAAKTQTIAYRILQAHQTSADPTMLKLKVDALGSHDITYVGIIQTARSSGLKEFPLPYVLTNCHNSLCAVGGTINEDDHVFGLSAAQKYGGVFVPAHQAVIHQYMREMLAGCGKIMLISDSHTRYGALGTMGFGEGGPELVKQLLGKTYDMPYPEISAVYLQGEPQPGVGPHDVAIALIQAVFKKGFVKNRVLEFVGPGVANLPVDFRNGIDVMTTETTCLSSIWVTDDKVKAYFDQHGRPDDFAPLHPGAVAYYDALITIDLSRIEPMIAFPFHPSNAFTIREANAHAADILHQVEEEGKILLDHPDAPFRLHTKLDNGRIRVDQGVIAGCAGGTFENIAAANQILGNRSIGQGEFALSVYPASQPVFKALITQGIIAQLIDTGATIRSAFCGPCFGAGDVPANNMLSIRHTTRNFPNREGSKPGEGQIASVALMDARSIAATALHQGILTPATDIHVPVHPVTYYFDRKVYDNRVYNGIGHPQPDLALKFGPNIADWPEMLPLPEHLLLRVCAVIPDPVTTTDELIPSGETSSYRSNPMRLAEFTLSRKDPRYVSRAKAAQHIEQTRQTYLKHPADEEMLAEIRALFHTYQEQLQVTTDSFDTFVRTTALGSLIAARKPGDGSAREQAASCQKVLGGWGNIAIEYATKRYRSNVINWGMLPLTVTEATFDKFAIEYLVYLPNIRNAVLSGHEQIEAYMLTPDTREPITLALPGLTSAEREIIAAGCLINYYRQA